MLIVIAELGAVGGLGGVGLNLVYLASYLALAAVVIGPRQVAGPARVAGRAALVTIGVIATLAVVNWLARFGLGTARDTAEVVATGLDGVAAVGARIVLSQRRDAASSSAQ